MAKLPNIIEKERSFFQTVFFAFMLSIKGSKKYSILRYITEVLGGLVVFLEFGGLAVIVNEFQKYGTDARPKIIILAFSAIMFATFSPVIFSSLKNYFWEIQDNDMLRYLQGLKINKMDTLDIGTVE